MDIHLIVATLFAVTIAFSNAAKRDGVMRKIYALETSMHEDMSYLRDSVDTNRVSIDAILQLLNNSQSGALVNNQQPQANNDPYDDTRFSEELARFKRAFADEKAIAREQQTNLMLGMSKLSEAISKHLEGITDVVSKLDNRFNGITDEVSKLNNMFDGITDDVSKLDNKFDGVTDEVSKLDNKLDGITDDVSKLDSRLTKIEQNIEQNSADLKDKVDFKTERLYSNISILVKDSTSNTVNNVKVNVADIVGHLEQTVLENIKTSDHSVKSIIEGQESQTYLLDIVAAKLYPCLASPAHKDFFLGGKQLGTTRLANASCSHDGGVQGRVEVNHYGVWGTVCDDVIDENNNGATVVCRSLGFSSGIVKNRAYFSQGSGTIWLDDVRCDGTEDNILDCPAKPIKDQTGCGHHEDVGVICR